MQSDSDSDDDIPLSEIQERLKVTVATEQFKGSKKMLKDLPKLAMACDRHDVSDRSAAAMSIWVLEEFWKLWQ